VEVPITTVKLEWKPKPSKKTPKPREADPKRLQARQKQLDIGMNTIGYQKYVEQVCKPERKKTDPRTPEKSQVCSKRSWDGQVRKWRRQLHMFDPEGTVIEDDDNLGSESEDEIELAERKLAINLAEIFAMQNGIVV